ncbi:hypothetical protein EE612_005186, partial [Oryza sativa]
LSFPSLLSLSSLPPRFLLLSLFACRPVGGAMRERRRAAPRRRPAVSAAMGKHGGSPAELRGGRARPATPVGEVTGGGAADVAEVVVATASLSWCARHHRKSLLQPRASLGSSSSSSSTWSASKRRWRPPRRSW